MSSVDVILVGGGLANGLIAMRLVAAHPQISITMIEALPTLGGNHTWSFFESDLTPEECAWLKPLVVHRWAGYEVRYPTYRRSLATGYATVTSERFHAYLSELSADGRLQVVTQNAQACTANEVVLADGTSMSGRTVIDGRGAQADSALQIAYQKFFGQVVEFEEPHGRTLPLLMDATVEQSDGYRFFYLLPFDERRMLVEDTRYTENVSLDRADMRDEIARYIARQGWRVRAIEREEEGVLPIVLDGDMHAFWRHASQTAYAGLRAALFHPTTGYSLPSAVRLADELAMLPQPLTTQSARACAQRRSLAQWQQHGFFRGLNRLMFFAALPPLRYKIFQRFYTLSPKMIERFYAGALTPFDKIRIFLGKPPVPLSAACNVLLGQMRKVWS